MRSMNTAMVPEQNHIRNDFWRSSSARAFGLSVAESALATLQDLLLVLVLPFTVLWIPLVRVPDVGTLTISDCVLLLLWGTTLLRFGTKLRKSSGENRALRIALYAFAPILFGCLGAFLFDSQSLLTKDILQHAKRFGLPAIIPLAMLISPVKLMPRIRVVAVASLLIMVLVPFTPLANLLPVSDVKTDISGGKGDLRGIGSLSNPNDFGYVALLGALIGLSHAAGARGHGFWRRAWGTVAVPAGLMGVVLSGSRSAMAALLAAALYIVFQSRISIGRKLCVVSILFMAMLVGWQVSSVYQDRMANTIEERSRDASTFARIEAQAVAFRTWVHHPLGVGFSNMPTATSEFSEDAQSFNAVTGSDSIYFDFLVATGALGFMCLILCFRNCWRLADLRPLPVEATYLKAGMVAAFVFGLATVAPASVFVAPFFFTITGLAGCLCRDDSLKHVRWA